MSRYFWRALALCGTLDIAYAAITVLMQGGKLGAMLRSIASGPFGLQVRDWGLAGPLAGLAVHYAIMAVMVAMFGLLAGRGLLRRLNPWIAGALYGLALFLVMDWIVLSLRWPTIYPSTDPMIIASGLFAHIALVGIPMALVARQSFGKNRPDNQ